MALGSIPENDTRRQTTIELRPYQRELVDDARNAYRHGSRAVLMNLATGGGKTFTASHIIQGAANKRNVCWWLCHRKELADQASNTFYAVGIPHGMIRSGFISDPNAIVQVASIQTIVRHLDKLPAPNFIVFDETHHIGASQWSKIFDRFPDAKILGLTATPWRLDGAGLGRWYQHMSVGPTVAELIEMGSLSPYRLFAPSLPDLAGVGMVGGDYNKSALAKAMDKPAIVGDAISHYRQLCNGKRAVAFAVSVAHSQHIAEQFNAAGIPAEHVDGSMQSFERDAIVERFKRGETLILTNCELFGEGFDVPAIEAAILMRPTKSLSLYLQQAGRALRPLPGKTEAIILDHAGNSLTHGLPDDVRDWSLDDRERKKRSAGSEVPVKQCTSCFFVYRPAPKCPQCGQSAPASTREIEVKEGTLQEVKRVVQLEKKKEQSKAQTLDDLIAIGKARNYKPGWALNVWKSRQGRRAFG